MTGKDGRVHVFVRNASKGLSTRVRDTAGQWSPWRKLAGGQIQEGLTATVDHSGRIHVFAAGHKALFQWTQSTPQGELVGRPLRQAGVPGEVPEVAAPPTARCCWPTAGPTPPRSPWNASARDGATAGHRRGS